MELNLAIVAQLNVSPRALWGVRRGGGARQELPVHQLCPDGDVEAAVGAGREYLCPLQDFERVGMHRHGSTGSVPIELANVAAVLVEAHQSMNGRDLFECGVDRTVCLGRLEAFDANADERAKPWLSTLNAFNDRIV
jgi:hypothetical protein